MSKKYLVIGGSSGIGKSIVSTLSKSHDVIATYRNHTLDSEHNTTSIQYEVGAGAKLELGIEELDGLVYCPGTINLKPFHRLKRQDFQNDFEINVLGAVEAIQSALPLLKKSEHASIVLFSTVAVQQGLGFHASVAASKGAIEGLGRSLAAELAPKIRVNVVAPSIVQTPLADRLLNTPEKIQASEKRHPLNKIGSAQDIANAAVFLLTDASGWMTGQVLHVDGGLSSIKSL